MMREAITHSPVPRARLFASYLAKDRAVGVLLIACPDTDREFSTGIQADRDTVNSLPDVSMTRVAPTVRPIARGDRVIRATSTLFRQWIGSRINLDAHDMMVLVAKRAVRTLECGDG